MPPLRDDKVLADWNGLAIAALAYAGSVFDEQSWIVAARTAFAFIVENMSNGDKLRHSWRQGKARTDSVLDDYANMSRAALSLFDATGDAEYLQHARTWVGGADAQFRDQTAGGYFLSDADASDLIARSKSAADNAVPSGNGTMVDVLAKLFYLTGESCYRDRAEETVRAFAGETPEYMVNMPMLLIGASFLAEGTQVVIVGDAADSATAALNRAAYNSLAPTAVVLRVTPNDTIPDTHPAAGKGMIGGVPTAYVCRGPVCGPPATDAQALRTLLAAC